LEERIYLAHKCKTHNTKTLALERNYCARIRGGTD